MIISLTGDYFAVLPQRSYKVHGKALYCNNENTMIDEERFAAVVAYRPRERSEPVYRKNAD